MDAQIWITGRVGSEVEIRTVNDISYANFRLGCTPRVNRRGEWTDLETTWITVSCSRVLAEGINGSLRKGDPVIAVGKLRTSKWQDQSGNPHEEMRLEATTVGHDLTMGVSVFTKRLPKVSDDVSEEQVAA